MKSNRLLHLFTLGLAAIMLAACNPGPAGQSAEAPAAELELNPPAPTATARAAAAAATEAEIETVDEEAKSSTDNTSTQSEADPAGLAETEDDVASRLTEAGFVAVAPSGKSLQPQLAQANIDLNDVVTLLPPDAIRAVNPEELPEIMVTAAEASLAGLSPDTRVMGVSINGDSHAYPIPFLSRHEIINTELGGRLIAVTW